MHMANGDEENAPLIENQREDWAIDIVEGVGELEPASECCIYKVPRRFRVANKDQAYTPQLISIGPLHHDDPNLAQMERQKRRYYNKFGERTSKKTLEGFKCFIKQHLKRICWCYDVELVFQTEPNASKFIEMILYDAVFIIELFLRNFDKEVNDFLFCRGWLSLELQTDLILLENQLPFFVLEYLYNLAFASRSDKPSFLHLACLYFELGEAQTFEGKEIKHLTDLIRCHVVKARPCSDDTDFDSVEIIDNMYSATMLREAGVKFKAVKDSWLNVKFEKGVLQIPCLYVKYETETIFRNLIAFEQCHSPENAYFCSYIQLLDFLVDTEEDVDLPEKKGIIINGMGSNAAVADMINNLMVGVAELALSYDPILKNLNQHYDSSWNRTKATLRHVYFNNLWRGTATVAAFIVVLLTLTQTILAILDRAMPTK
ncbi:hypothetical protein REPUB_Repub12eG0202300 [Reevesia pubescens]